ncbi:MAG: glycerol-3-phosphate 1-O-acyltransferase PlsY [Gammaproteobacteria bacterium]|nr:glycerol-3-phosphate 1-O-acyltransferase PlsY [Gammaproteobacteria bacterium]
MIELGIKFTLAYLLGSVLGSLIVGWLRGGVDIRNLGSGNAGGTNALRTQGKWFALWVMVVDIGKGIAAVAWIPALDVPGVGIDAAVSRDLILYAVGFGAVLGHVFPVWFGFRGGKGGATAAGLLLYFDPLLAVPVLGAWLAIILVTGFVGLSTMGAAVGAAAFIGLTRLPEQHAFFTFSCLVAALIVYTHRGNIRRMLDRTEPRFRRFQGSK